LWVEVPGDGAEGFVSRKNIWRPRRSYRQYKAIFEKVNSFFKNVDADPEFAFNQLEIQYKSLYLRAYSDTGVLLQLDQIDFGAKFLEETNKYLQSVNFSTQGKMKVQDVKERCSLMLQEAILQLNKRFMDFCNFKINVAKIL